MSFKAKDEKCFYCGKMHPRYLDGCVNKPEEGFIQWANLFIARNKRISRFTKKKYPSTIPTKKGK